MEDGRQAKFLFLPDGEDPDTLVRKQGRERFEGLVENAQPLEGFLFDVLARGIDTSSLDGRARYSKTVLPYLRKLPAGVFRELMFRDLAERTGLELTSLMQLEAPEPTPSEPPPAEYGEYPVQETEDAPPPDFEEGPRQRSPVAAGDSGYANIAQGAIALLLHKPDIARLVEPDQLEGLAGDDISLLREVLVLLHRRP